MKAHTRPWFALIVLAVITLGVINLWPRPARAAGPWYVAPGGSDSNSCLSTGSPCATINGAIGKASSGDVINVAIGTYADGALLDKSVTLLGGWDSTFTTPNGSSILDGVVTINTGVIALIERVTVQNGGPGIYNIGGAVTLNNSIIQGNTGAGGFGGGIFNGGNLIVNNSVISGNTTFGSGGGIYNRNENTTAILNNSAVINNTGIYGGGIYASAGTVILNNTTVSGNTASSEGGGIKTACGGDCGIVILNNSTVSGNTASSVGGGVAGGGGPITLRNTIVAGNSALGGSDCAGPITSAGYNLIGITPDGSCSFTPITGDLTNVDPKLGPLQNNGGPTPTHALLAGSPAINAGNPSGCMGSAGMLTTDQRGAPRLGRCDIGAYEVSFANMEALGTFDLGTLVTYKITLNNETSTNITSLAITDTLPISLTYQSGSLTATNGSYDETNGIITWNGSVPAGSSTTITFQAAVNQNTPSCSFITNVAIVGGPGFEFEVRATGVVPCACNATKSIGNPVLPVGSNGSWDDADVFDPTVIKEGNTYKMWYAGSDGATLRIGYATSTDGIIWTKYGNNPVFGPGSGWDGSGVFAPTIIFDGGVYNMWYTGVDSNGVARIGYATSPDGINWTRYGSNSVLDIGAAGGWEDSDINGPSVIKEGNVYHMWYTGYDGITPRLGHATSGNGIIWTMDPANPALDLGAPGGWDWLHVYGPSVVAYDGKYLLWYSGGTLPSAYQIGYAISADGRTWVRQGELIAEGVSGSFDADSADYPSVIVDGNEFKVWYSGLNDGGAYTIGYAVAELCGASSPPPPPSGLVTLYLPMVMRTYNAACPAYYTDEFNDPESGWLISDTNNRTYAYVSGEYQILVKNAFQGYAVTPGAKATDFTASVTARRTSGDFGAYGIEFGINENWSQFYQVLIDDQFFSIWRYNNGWTALQGWTFSGAIRAGTSANRLKVIRQGASITVYVNNQSIATVSDSTFTGLRRIGLVAESDDIPLDARFDTFSLYPASCGVNAAEAGFEMGKPEAHEVPVPPGLKQPQSGDRSRP